jgi:UDP-glucose 4-epimerase
MKIEGGKFVVTGGVSLIGSHIAEQLLAAGAREVVLFDNYSLGTADLIGDLLGDKRVRIVRGDILRVNEMYDAFKGASGVFAAAAFLTLPLSQNPPLGLAVNVQGHANLLEACRYTGVGKVVFSSSVAIYGDPGAETIREDSALNLAPFSPAAALYSATKIIGENLGRLYHQKLGVQFVSLRYSTVYGERQHYRGVNALYIMENYDRIVKGERPTIPDDGREVHDYIHVSDVAAANVAAMASEVSGESINVCTGVATTLNDLVRTLLSVMGSKLEPEYRTDSKAVRASTATRMDFSITKAEKLLGWKPKVNLAEGVSRLVAWRRKQDGAGRVS